jgi:hypothetical protein
MFPSTLTGLFFFVVLLLPGFAYLVGKERHGTERHTSPFRETISVVAASVTTEVIVLGLFALVRWILPSRTPDVGALLHGGNAYIAGHYRSLAVWTLCMLALAVAIAYLATVQQIRDLLKWMPAIGAYPHDSTVSGWWLLFEAWKDKRDVQVLCTLEDGFAVQGIFKSFNNSADDSPDRDLILIKPLKVRQAPDLPMTDFNAGMFCVSARRIVSLFVSYPLNQSQTSQPDSPTELAAAEPPEADPGVAEPLVAEHP